MGGRQSDRHRALTVTSFSCSSSLAFSSPSTFSAGLASAFCSPGLWLCSSSTFCPGFFCCVATQSSRGDVLGRKKKENNVNGVPFFVRDQRFLDISPPQRGVSPHKPIPPWPSHARPAPGRWLRARCRFPGSFNPARGWESAARPRHPGSAPIAAAAPLPHLSAQLSSGERERSAPRAATAAMAPALPGRRQSAS